MTSGRFIGSGMLLLALAAAAVSVVSQPQGRAGVGRPVIGPQTLGLRHGDTFALVDDPYSLSDDPLVVAAQLSNPVAFCYAEGTPDEVMAHFEWARQVAPGPLAYFLGGSWTSVGVPAELTWSLVPDGLPIGSTGSDDNNGVSGPSEMFSRLDLLFGGNRALWISQFEDTFARWSELTGVNYTRITFGGNDWDDGASWGSSGNPNRGDIRIAMRNIDGSSGTLAYNFFPTNADMVMDRNENWSSSAGSYRFFRNIVMHEAGHGLGARHICPPDNFSLMEPFINTGFDGPQHDDIRAIQRQHGDAYEPDNTPAQATDLGTLLIGNSIEPSAVPAPAVFAGSILSLDDNNEEDWFYIEAGEDLLVNITLSPVGAVYDSSPQNSNGSCNSGNIIDTTPIANLALDLYEAADTVNPIATAFGNPAGQTESIVEEFLDAQGGYYVRVRENAAMAGETQLYSLTIAAVAPGACCLPDGACEARASQDCESWVGYHYGNGTACTDVLNPACVATDTFVTVQLSSQNVFPGGSVLMELWLENVTELSAYQMKVATTLTSGTGTLTVPCPDGSLINENICVSLPNLTPTGEKCDTAACTGGAICVDRPDYVFTGKDTLPGLSCSTQEFVNLLNAVGDSVDVGASPVYIGEFVLEASPDAVPGTTFEVEIVDPAEGASLLIDKFNEGVPFQRTGPLTITVADPSALQPPAPAVGFPFDVSKNRYVSFVPSNNTNLTAYQVTHVGSGQSRYVGAPETSPPAIVGLGLCRLTPSLVLRDWSGESIVHATGCQIATGETYEIRATFDGANFSAPLIVGTTPVPSDGRFWSDVVGGFSGGVWTAPNGLMNGFDVTAVLRTFQNNPANPGTSLERSDLNPSVPDHVVNGQDVLQAVNAFSLTPYPFPAPGSCP